MVCHTTTVLIPFIFSPRHQHLGRWHRHRASRADGTVAADHFHHLLAANAPAAGTVVERRGRPLAPLAQATSYADPSVARPPPTPPPPASSAWRTAPTPFGLTAGRRLAFVGLTAGRGLDLQRLPDGNHALASVGPTADRQPRPPSKPAPLFQPRHPAPKQLMQLLLRFFYSSSVLSIFSSSSVLPPRLPACCSHECSTIGCCAGLVFISAYRSPSVSSASSRDIFLPLFLFVQSL